MTKKELRLKHKNVSDYRFKIAYERSLDYLDISSYFTLLLRRKKYLSETEIVEELHRLRHES